MDQLFMIYKCDCCNKVIIVSDETSVCPGCGYEYSDHEYKGEVYIPISEEVSKKIETLLGDD